MVPPTTLHPRSASSERRPPRASVDGVTVMVVFAMMVMVVANQTAHDKEKKEEY